MSSARPLARRLVAWILGLGVVVPVSFQATFDGVASAANPSCTTITALREDPSPFLSVKGTFSTCTFSVPKKFCVALVSTATGVTVGTKCTSSYVTGTSRIWGYYSFACSVGASYYGRAYVLTEGSGTQYNAVNTSPKTCTASLA